MNEQQLSQTEIEKLFQEFRTGASLQDLCTKYGISSSMLIAWAEEKKLLHVFLEKIFNLETENKDLKTILSDNADKLFQSNKQLDSFTYSVSHDLGAPIRAILGFSKIIKEEYTFRVNDQEFDALTDRVVANATKLQCQVNELVNYSRMLRKDLTKSLVDLDRLVRTILHELTSHEPSRKFDINVAVLESVWADENMISLAFRHLISNALKFTRKKEVAYIAINCQKEEKNITFSISDNGVGFEMHYADKLFGVFQKLHKVSDYEGTGIGLALTAVIIQRHEGKVWANAEPGKGATFFFTLPV